jgi:3-methyladenine DNA glycosylase AlkD
MVAALDKALRKAGHPERAVAEKAYLKSPIAHYGATVWAIRAAAKEIVRTQGPFTRRQLLALVRALWSSPAHEPRMAATILLEEHVDVLEPEDLVLVEEMIRGSFTWAYVDGLAASVAGPLVERYPQLAAELDGWAKDENFWVRRSALLALLGPLRRGEGDWKRFARYADSMLAEKEFFIRKAIGWVLRETSKKQPDRVRKYVAARLHRLSGITFREAVRRLPDEDREELRQRYQGLAASK